ncbi:MAG: polyprenyl synthetase family protein [Deltaproteobacteria bacterium]|nr:polyprenyl synthetase family protein [Deltaproteobacteria bacterium]
MDPLLDRFISESRLMVDEALDRYIPSPEIEPRVLHEAMRYSLFAGGKRVRPILAMAAADMIGADKFCVIPLAAALECIHTYSLIHDDLPPMDDDDLRRGKLTSHKVFGESTAILAGDALLTVAFEILSGFETSRIIPSHTIVEVIRDVAVACGSRGLIAGQIMDMIYEGEAADDSIIEKIMLNKTGALIRASVTNGARLAGANRKEIDILFQFGEKLGKIFQIKDDLLDLEGDATKLGKAVRKDDKRGKATYPSVHGPDRSKKLVMSLLAEANKMIEPFGKKAQILILLAEYVSQRVN